MNESSGFRRVRFLMLGGFLGAGKTTALLRLARGYATSGLRVGIITNDQAEGLVDTLTFRSAGFSTEEIPSGCFCCHFDELIAASGRLADGFDPDVILAEPVGSCTDLVHAVITPLRQVYGARFDVAPYAVLLDPDRALEALSGEGPRGFSEKVTYIFKMQQNEADVIAVNKSDRLDEAGLAAVMAVVAQNFPRARPVAVSARTGEGFEAFRALIEGPGAAGANGISVDYGVYAEGEAALGWLNLTARLGREAPWDGDELMARFAKGVAGALAAEGVEIGHFKMALVADGGGRASVHVTGAGRAAEVASALGAPLRRGELLVNLRAESGPERLEACVRDWLGQVFEGRGIGMEITRCEAFAPAAPVPPPPERMGR